MVKSNDLKLVNEEVSLIRLIKENKNLSIIDAKTSSIYCFDDILLTLDDVFIQGKNLVFLYLDSSINSLVNYATFFNSNSTLVLLSNNIENSLKENLENEYQPFAIFDENRNAIKDYALKNLSNKYFETTFYLNELNKGGIINKNCKVLLSTSGTTGSPKFVKLSEYNLVQNAQSIIDYLPIQNNDSTPLNLPLHYSYGLSVFNSNAIAGGKIICGLPDILEKKFWNYLSEYGFTSIAGVPFIYEMLKRIGFLKKQYPSLKYISQAGGNLSQNIKKEFYSYCRNNEIEFFVMYGQTEATARISYVPPKKLDEKLRSIGVPIKNGALSIDSETGELLYQGPNIFGGYALKKEDLVTWEDILVLRTGDIAIKDDDEYFFIEGRLKRFVKINGNRVNLDEIEKYLKNSLNISLLACNGINDKFILISHSLKELDEILIKKQIFDIYKIHGSSVKFKYFDHLPITQNGKINYKLIESLYLEK